MIRNFLLNITIIISLNLYSVPFNLDTTFGNYGLVITLCSGNSRIQALAVQSDNKIIAGGFIVTPDKSQQFKLVRYAIDGSIDTTFVGNDNFSGIETTSIGISGTINALLVQPNNAILAIGSSKDISSFSVCLVRYTDKGLLDTSFNPNAANAQGVVTTKLGDYCTVYGAALQPDGKIVVTGMVLNQSTQSLFVIRYLTNGSLDTSFGTSGIIVEHIGSECSGNSIIIESDGKIIVGGYSIINGVQLFTLLRYLDHGTLDSSFGNNGIVTTPVPQTEHSRIVSLLKQADGKIVAVGISQVGKNRFSCLARYGVAGSLDATFGVNGTTINKIVNSSDSPSYAASLQADGSILVVGSTLSCGTYKFALTRYTIDGVLDTFFGNQGTEITEQCYNAEGNAIVVLSNGQSIAGGVVNGNFALARFNQVATFIKILSPNNGSTIPLYTTIISGTSSQPNSQVQVGIDGTHFATVTTDSNGNWATPISYELVPGVHTINAKLLSFENVIALATSSFTVPVSTLSSITLVWDEKVTGTNGGASTAGYFATRALNKLLGDTIHVNLNNNQITLQPGTYIISVIAPAYAVGNHQCRLQNITDGVTEKYGSSSISSTTDTSQTHSYLEHRLVLNLPKTFEIQHWARTAGSNHAFGSATGIADNVEIYTQVKIIRL